MITDLIIDLIKRPAGVTVINHKLTGRLFLSILRKNSILNSTFAYKAKIDMQLLAELKTKEDVPAHLVRKLMLHYSYQFTPETQKQLTMLLK